MLTLFDAAHALAHFQTDIPEQHQEGFDRLAKGLCVATQQDKKVDIRVRMQFPAAVAADCQ